MHAGKIVLTAATAAALVLGTPGVAWAKPTAGPSAAEAPKVITTAVVLPFNIAVDRQHILVADGGTGLVSQVRANGTLKTIATAPGSGNTPGEAAGVAISRSGRSIAYTTTFHPTQFENVDGTLHIRHAGGGTLNVDLENYEKTKNPDKKKTYGPVGDVSDCAKDAIAAISGQRGQYTGVKDSHPYSVAAYDRRSWLVADAGGNDLLKVDRFGKVSTVAVFPAQKLTFTADIVEKLGADKCLTGVTNRFEAVPTDVEVAKNGMLYVTVLAGGPESPVIGGRSSVYRVNPKNGNIKRVATGLLGATNLAQHKGKIYVAEFYGGQISVIKNGKPKLYKSLPGAVSVESGRGHLYAGTFPGPTGQGSIVRLK